MKLRRVYRFKLEPNLEQTQKLYQLAGARRFVYNWALARRKEHYRATGQSLGYGAQNLELTQLKAKPETLWLKEADSQSLQESLRDLDKAFQNCFAKRTRFPKFAAKKKGHFAFRVPQRVKVEGFPLKSGKVYGPKIGWVRIRQSQQIEGETKSATFKRDVQARCVRRLVCDLDKRV